MYNCSQHSINIQMEIMHKRGIGFPQSSKSQKKAALIQFKLITIVYLYHKKISVSLLMELSAPKQRPIFKSFMELEA